MSRTISISDNTGNMVGVIMMRRTPMKDFRDLRWFPYELLEEVLTKDD